MSRRAGCMRAVLRDIRVLAGRSLCCGDAAGRPFDFLVEEGHSRIFIYMQHLVSADARRFCSCQQLSCLHRTHKAQLIAERPMIFARPPGCGGTSSMCVRAVHAEQQQEPRASERALAAFAQRFSMYV